MAVVVVLWQMGRLETNVPPPPPRMASTVSHSLQTIHLHDVRWRRRLIDPPPPPSPRIPRLLKRSFVVCHPSDATVGRESRPPHPAPSRRLSHTLGDAMYIRGGRRVVYNIKKGECHFDCSRTSTISVIIYLGSFPIALNVRGPSSPLQQENDDWTNVLATNLPHPHP